MPQTVSVTYSSFFFQPLKSVKIALGSQPCRPGHRVRYGQWALFVLDAECESGTRAQQPQNSQRLNKLYEVSTVGRICLGRVSAAWVHLWLAPAHLVVLQVQAKLWSRDFLPL